MNTTSNRESADQVEGKAESITRAFEGFARWNGRTGIRNRVLVLPSVICSHVVADRIAARVSGATSASHDHGCAQMGADNEQTERTLLGVATNPNVAGTLLVGLGCEHVQSGSVADQLEALGAPVREISIQNEGGVDETIDRGERLAEELVNGARSERIRTDLSDLTVGVISGDLNRATVETADPLVGSFVDRVVDAGGNVVVAGTERLAAHPREAVSMAASEKAAGEVDDLVARLRDRQAKQTRIRRCAEDRPFNEGTRAWGSGPIRDVLRYGEVATHESGLAIVESPSEFAEAATALTAAGAQVILHVTDEGVPTGHPVAPVVKVTGNQETYEALSNDIDVDAATTTEAELIDYVVDVADGEPCRAEVHGVSEFAITRVDPSM